MKSKFCELAKKISKKSTHHQHKLGCVIVNKNRVVSAAANQLKTSPRSPHPYFSLHAEVSAILGYSYADLKNCVAYVYRERKCGLKSLAKPCPSCELALRQVGIKKVYYTVNNGWKEEKLT